MATQPEHIDWMPSVDEDDDTVFQPPSTEKRNLGWTSNEKPPFQYFNWAFKRMGDWFRYLAKTAAQYDVVIGTGSDCTHATLEDAVADANVGTDITVLLREDITGGDTATSLSKAGWRIHARPGVTFAKGLATTGLSIEAARIEVHGLRFSGFSGVGTDKAVVFTSDGDYGRVLNCNFSSCDTEVDDTSATAGRKPAVIGSIKE